MLGSRILFVLHDGGCQYTAIVQHATPNKMIDEVAKHLIRHTRDGSIPCPHPACKVAGLVLPGVSTSHRDAKAQSSLTDDQQIL